MATRPHIATIIYEIRIPILLAMVWAALVFVVPLTPWVFVPFAILQLPVRIALVVWAGYLVAHRTSFGLLGASIAGVLMFFADHVLVKGLIFVATGELMAAGGVVVSYLMFFWVAMIVAVVGGLFGRPRGEKEDAAI